MKTLVYSAYAKNPIGKKSRMAYFELTATILSIASYSLIVSQNYAYGYFLGFIASLILTAIMLNKNSMVLTALYTFFIVANLTGFLQFFTI